MTSEILKYINETLTNAKINYAFMRWNKEIVYPYWVGEYDENDVTEEDSCHEYTFRLTGTTRKSWSELEQDKQTIENLFNSHTTILANAGVVISYVGALLVPTGDDELKRMQINLQILEWRN